MSNTVLSRPLVHNGRALRTLVVATPHKLIAQVLDGTREVFAVALDRKFAESEEGQTLFGPLNTLAERLAAEAERPFLRAE